VSEASVTVDQEMVSEITKGFLILLGVEEEDCSDDLAWLVNKVPQMRVFEDNEGKINRSLKDIEGESQFTLHTSTKKGNRPSFIKAVRPKKAEALYEEFCEKLQETLTGEVARRRFGADMKVALINDGPVTTIIDSKDRQ